MAFLAFSTFLCNLSLGLAQKPADKRLKPDFKMVPRLHGSLLPPGNWSQGQLLSTRPPTCLTWAGPNQEWKPLGKGGLTFANQRLSQSCQSGMNTTLSSPRACQEDPALLSGLQRSPAWEALTGSWEYIPVPLSTGGGGGGFAGCDDEVTQRPACSVSSMPPAFLLPLGMLSHS